MIAEPIAYVEADKLLVDAYDALARPLKDPNYWADGTLQNLKARIKSFYIAAQSSHCCYCDRHLGTENHRAWDIEHIADRNKYAWFMFTPTNLAAACPDCNVAKSTTEALTTPGRKTYPTSSADFRLLHPHFDRFEDHIFRSGHVYVPKTTKGRRTIYACNLLRFAEKYIDWGNAASDRRFEERVDAAFDMDGAMAQDAVDAIAAELTRLRS